MNKKGGRNYVTVLLKTSVMVAGLEHTKDALTCAHINKHLQFRDNHKLLYLI